MEEDEVYAQGDPHRAIHAFMFWLLTAMGLVAALPAILLPPLQSLHQLSEIECQEQEQLVRLRAKVAEQQRLNEALRADPQVTARLALRELGYTRAGGREVFIEHPAPAERDRPAGQRVSTTRVGLRWLAAYTQRETRYLLLGMGMALIGFALVSYRPATTQA